MRWQLKLGIVRRGKQLAGWYIWDWTLHLTIAGGNEVPSLQALRFWIFNRTSLIVTADTRGCLPVTSIRWDVGCYTEIGLWSRVNSNSLFASNVLTRESSSLQLTTPKTFLQIVSCSSLSVVNSISISLWK